MSYFALDVEWLNNKTKGCDLAAIAVQDGTSYVFEAHDKISLPIVTNSNSKCIVFGSEGKPRTSMDTRRFHETYGIKIDDSRVVYLDELLYARTGGRILNLGDAVSIFVNEEEAKIQKWKKFKNKRGQLVINAETKEYAKLDAYYTLRLYQTVTEWSKDIKPDWDTDHIDKITTDIVSKLLHIANEFELPSPGAIIAALKQHEAIRKEIGMVHAYQSVVRVLKRIDIKRIAEEKASKFLKDQKFKSEAKKKAALENTSAFKTLKQYEKTFG